MAAKQMGETEPEEITRRPPMPQLSTDPPACLDLPAGRSPLAMLLIKTTTMRPKHTVLLPQQLAEAENSPASPDPPGDQPLRVLQCSAPLGEHVAAIAAGAATVRGVRAKVAGVAVAEVRAASEV